MVGQVKKYNSVSNILVSNNKSSIKEKEWEVNDYVDNRNHVFKTVINSGHVELHNYDKVKQMQNNITNGKANAGEEIIPDNIKIEINIGQYGIKFGTPTGFCNKECLWKIKGGQCVVNKDITKCFKWMKYINHVRSIFEQNLQVFQCDKNLYYQSIRKMQERDELLLHFGEQYDSLNQYVQVDFAPSKEHIVMDVFAWTFCCLGFSSSSNLVKRKTVCCNNADGKFSRKEFTQCSFCKIYLDQKEYFKHHIAFCSDIFESMNCCICKKKFSRRENIVQFELFANYVKPLDDGRHSPGLFYLRCLRTQRGRV